MFDQILSWDSLWWVLMLCFITVSVGLIVLVLLQQGKGGGLGGALGGGGGENVFGAKSAQTLPVKLTYILASFFLVLAISLSIVSGRTTQGDAPDLATVTSESATDSSGAPASDLDKLGIGTGVIKEDAHDAAAVVVPPVVVPEEAPVEEKTAETPSETAPAEATPVETPASEETTTDAAE